MTKPKGKSSTPVPGSYPVGPSRSGSSHSSVTTSTAVSSSKVPRGSDSDEIASTSKLFRNKLSIQSGGEGDTPSASLGKHKNGKRSISLALAPADELGQLVDSGEGDDTARPKGKGKGKASAAAPTARLVVKTGVDKALNSNSNRRAPAPRTPTETIEISSDSDAGKSSSEMLRLRLEIRDLKKQLAAQRRKPTVVTTTKDSEVARLTKELAEQKDEVTTLRNKDRVFRDSLQQALQCQICVDLLHQPYALSPCGHVCCLTCLQEWFKTPSEGNEEDEMGRKHKSCPYCRARIRSRPVKVFIVQAIVETLDSEAHKAALEDAPPPEDDPWDGIFNQQEQEDDDGEDLDDEEDGYDDNSDEDDFCENCGGNNVNAEGFCENCRFQHDMSDIELDVPQFYDGYLYHSDVDLEVDADEVDEDLWDSAPDDTDPEEWVMPQPALPVHPLSRTENLHLTNKQFALCSRGVPFEMIQKYSMKYTEELGLCARVEGGRGALYLGWNIRHGDIDDVDVDGSTFIALMTMDISERPYAWKVQGERGYGNWSAFRLVRRGTEDDGEEWEDE